MPGARSLSAARHGELIALGGLLALAAALRAIGSGYGLPYPLLNPDEESIVPRAWRMVHGGGLDPDWFDYPTLWLYLLAPLQALVDQPSYGLARLVAVLVGVGGVAAAWWLGRRAYGTLAGLVGAAGVAVATTHVAYSQMAVTDVVLTALVTLAVTLCVAGRLEWAGVAAGLAASAKYPGTLAAVPVIVAGWAQWRRLGSAAALAVGAFVVTSPFVVLRAGAAWEDISRVQRLARAGWLGFEDDPVAPIAFVDRLWSTAGPVVAVTLVGLAVAARRRTRTDLVLLSFAGAYALYLVSLGAHFDRYVLPIVPVLFVLAGRVRVLAPVTIALLLVPLAWSVADARDRTHADTRLRAADWIDANVPPTTRIAADPSTLPLSGRDVIRLELPGPGIPADRRRDLRRLQELGVEYVLVSGAVTDRVRSAATRYPREAAFYDELDRRAELVHAVAPGQGGLRGPWVRVYRL